MKMFAIRDLKGNYFYQPQVFRNTDDAIRACKNSVNENSNSLFSKNSEDFALFELAEWEEKAGKLTPHDAKIHVIDLIDLKAK